MFSLRSTADTALEIWRQTSEGRLLPTMASQAPGLADQPYPAGPGRALVSKPHEVVVSGNRPSGPPTDQLNRYPSGTGIHTRRFGISPASDQRDAAVRRSIPSRCEYCERRCHRRGLHLVRRPFRAAPARDKGPLNCLIGQTSLERLAIRAGVRTGSSMVGLDAFCSGS